MGSCLSKRINDFINNERISKEQFNELKYVAEITNFNEKILNWFRYLQSIEVIGWRNKLVTKKLCQIIEKEETLHFYALFCPSYIKGKGEAGFRIDDVGNTTKNGLKTLMDITRKTRELGFNCSNPEAIFFDIALEQPEKTVNMLSDLDINIQNFCKYVPEGMSFSLLSKKFPELMDIVGYGGIIIEPLPVDEVILARIIERGRKFYELFGWNKEKIINRSKVIASSEATVGNIIRHHMPNAIMVYTPTMLERAQVYSGKHQNDPLPIVFPKK